MRDSQKLSISLIWLSYSFLQNLHRQAPGRCCSWCCRVPACGLRCCVRKPPLYTEHLSTAPTSRGRVLRPPVLEAWCPRTSVSCWSLLALYPFSKINVSPDLEKTKTKPISPEQFPKEDFQCSNSLWHLQALLQQFCKTLIRSKSLLFFFKIFQSHDQ